MGLGGHRPSELSGELPGVHSHLDDVVHECQQRGQGEGGHEQSDEAKLDHCDTGGAEVRKRETAPSAGQQGTLQQQVQLKAG